MLNKYLCIMTEKETQIGRAKMKQPPQLPLSFKLKCRAVKTKHLDCKSVTPDKLSDDSIAYFKNAFKKEIDDLQNQIDAYNEHGVFVSNEFGDDPHIGISQKVITQAINKLWQKIEDITGEMLQGIYMTVDRDYFISEDGATVHITANTVEANGIFEKIQFIGNGELIAEYENTDFVEFDHHLDESTVIKCVAKIMGIEYSREKIITHYNSFFIGAGTSYEDIMNVEHVQAITRGIRGQYEIIAEEDDHIIIVLGNSLRQAFMRADISFTEIEFTEQEVTIDDKTYAVLTSVNTYNAGTYKVFING